MYERVRTDACITDKYHSSLFAMSTVFPVSRGSMQGLHFPPSSMHSLLYRLIQTQVLRSSRHVVHDDYCSWPMRGKGRRTYCSFFLPKILCVCACQKWLNEVTAFWVVIIISRSVLKFILHVLLSNELMSCTGKEAINRTRMLINSKLLVKLVDFGEDYTHFFIIT